MTEKPLIYRISPFCRVVGKLPDHMKQTYIPSASWEEDHIEHEIIHMGRRGTIYQYQRMAKNLRQV